MLRDEYGQEVDLQIEKMSRELCQEFIRPTDTVLELGARYGSVSIFIRNILSTNSLVAVECDPNVQACLANNMIANNASFHIINGTISSTPLYVVHHNCVWEQKTYKNIDRFLNQRAISTIATYPLEYAEKLINGTFTVLVADCEGYLVDFFNQYRDFIKSLDVIIYEEDCTKNRPINGDYVDYTEFETFLGENGFTLVKDVTDHIGLHNKVYSRR
jgi:FkbM family methyltransferase